MQVKPLHDRVLVKRADPITETAGGILIPDNDEKPVQGTVIAVGPGYRTPEGITPLGVKEGDTVLFGKYAGSDVKVEDNDFLIMREDDILGTIQ